MSIEGVLRVAERGRRNRYEDKVKPYLEKIRRWRRDGLTEEQICNLLGVGVSTFARYKNDFEELREALKRGKEDLIGELEDSLYKKAMGFEYEEIDQFIEVVNGKEIKKIRKTTRHQAPDTGALAFALKNLAPEKWKDRREIGVSGGIDNVQRLEITERLLNDEESVELAKELYRRSNPNVAKNSEQGL